MSEDSKRNDGGALVAKPPAADDRKSASLSASSITVSKKIIIKSADMKDDMQKEAVDIAIAAFEKNSVEKDVAEHIKKEFDMKHGPIYPTAMAARLGSTTQT
ncbi:dynein light chain 1, cytoplasmic-like [Ipomoea triloba]|uniref:dynein light chain 1, cytoplasmic-like n=1 Tax=Ipomoea triloba TaxID=35885 RepID=UPI00125D05F5|nr:dynein light chain 1, cytoplasmic-like [Ipomoea triloba]XP_031092545.1 dynein light chain 1, cytoplasmic-like [Ipomoea triloba]